MHPKPAGPAPGSVGLQQLRTGLLLISHLIPEVLRIVMLAPESARLCVICAAHLCASA